MHAMKLLSAAVWLALIALGLGLFLTPDDRSRS